MLIGKQISGLLLLFSSKRVCCHSGAHHNAEMDLYGTDFVCANRLRAIYTIIPLHSERPRYSLPIPAKFIFVAFLHEPPDIFEQFLFLFGDPAFNMEQV